LVSSSCLKGLERISLPKTGVGRFREGRRGVPKGRAAPFNAPAPPRVAAFGLLIAVEGRPKTPAAPARAVISPRPLCKARKCRAAGMLRARAPVGQGLGLRRLDGHEALPLQALEYRERRRQWLTALAVMPAPVRDRRLDDGDQELGRLPSVTRFHRRAADPGEPLIRSRRSHPRHQRPQQPTRSGRSLFPATPMISGAAIA